MTPKISVVEWKDHFNDAGDGWTSVTRFKTDEPALIVSAGLLVHETEQYLILAMDWGRDGQVNTVGKILKNNIVRRKDIPVPRAIWKELKNPSAGDVTPQARAASSRPAAGGASTVTS